MSSDIRMSGSRTVQKKIWLNLSRAAALPTRSFVCFILSLYNAFMYGVYYLMFTTFTPLFLNTYGFSIGTAGLAYLGLGVGFVLASVLGAYIGDSIYATLVDRNGGIGKPEMRLPAMIFGSIFVPIGLLCVIHTLPYSNSLAAMYQLLWMVCTSANPLDRSYNRNGDIWLRIHDNLSPSPALSRRRLHIRCICSRCHRRSSFTIWFWVSALWFPNV